MTRPLDQLNETSSKVAIDHRGSCEVWRMALNDADSYKVEKAGAARRVSCVVAATVRESATLLACCGRGGAGGAAAVADGERGRDQSACLRPHPATRAFLATAFHHRPLWR